VPGVSYPQAVAAIGIDGTIFVAGQSGLQRSEDDGQSWQMVIDGEAGQVARISFGRDGVGYAGSANGAYLHRTADRGKTWGPLKAPFGVLPLTALQVVGDEVIAASYDPRQSSMHLWRSRDHGANWQRELTAQTSWPLVSLCSTPQLATMGDSVLKYEQGSWKQTVPEKGAGLLRVVGNREVQFVLNTTGILRSEDDGKSWKRDDEGVLIQEVLDLELLGQKLFVLLTGGRVWIRKL
jgi:photosystem II stability/assembly factor-like uncharacterized protein